MGTGYRTVPRAPGGSRPYALGQLGLYHPEMGSQEEISNLNMAVLLCETAANSSAGVDFCRLRHVREVPFPKGSCGGANTQPMMVDEGAMGLEQSFDPGPGLSAPGGVFQSCRGWSAVSARS